MSNAYVRFLYKTAGKWEISENNSLSLGNDVRSLFLSISSSPLNRYWKCHFLCGMNFGFFSHMLTKNVGWFFFVNATDSLGSSLVERNTDANVFMAKGISIFSKRWQKKWLTLITFSTVITVEMDFENRNCNAQWQRRFYFDFIPILCAPDDCDNISHGIRCYCWFVGRCFHSWCVISFYLTKYFVILSVNRHAVRWLRFVVPSDSYHVSSFQS